MCVHLCVCMCLSPDLAQDAMITEQMTLLSGPGCERWPHLTPLNGPATEPLPHSLAFSLCSENISEYNIPGSFLSSMTLNYSFRHRIIFLCVRNSPLPLSLVPRSTGAEDTMAASSFPGQLPVSKEKSSL